MAINFSNDELPVGSLVLYRKRPARLIRADERLEIETQTSEVLKVRRKDIQLLHPGPLASFSQLSPQSGDVELAWQLLLESAKPSSLESLAELIFGAYTPATAWATWEHIQDGLYFQVTDSGILARSATQVAQEIAQRQARAEEKLAWDEFLQNARQGRVHPEKDSRFLREVEDLALGRRRDSSLLNHLGLTEHPETAHRMLLEWGYWNATVNPYPARLGLPSHPPDLPVQDFEDEKRLDLTELLAYAIDDRHNQDPDDALSLGSIQLAPDGSLLKGRLWVHVADTAALAPPDSPLDLEARMRGATLYLPEGVIPMLPWQAIPRLGLGLSDPSPALSFEIELDSAGNPTLIQICSSWVRVQRKGYDEAEPLLEHHPFRELCLMTEIYQHRRRQNGALSIDLPEATLRVVDGQVLIQPLQRLRSRDLVREAMLIAGEAAAKHAQTVGIPFPYTVQEAPILPDELQRSLTNPNRLNLMSTQYALRRFLKRSQVSSIPSGHAGLGLACYSRATSPMRRYADLIAHQQLRAYLTNRWVPSSEQLLERAGAAEVAAGVVSQAEALSRRHWTLVYLLQHPDWKGSGVLVERIGLRGTVIIPDLALETPLHLRQEMPLDTELQLALSGVNLPELQAHFSVL